MSGDRAIVFAGPSLAGAAVGAPVGVAIRPPAMLGDLARAAGERPAAIGLIDGRFETVPAVWHKEILWAMEAGVAVYGAASMGALRAAELEPFGMRGIGAIFEAFRTGALEDDDEVAVLHGPPETGSVPLSTAMVDIRATLEAAARAGVLTATAAAALVAAAKALFYKERTWPAVLAAGELLSPPPREALAAWLPSGRVHQKRQDAEALMTAVAAHPVAAAPPVTRRFARPRTVEDIVRRASRSPAPVADALLDQLRLEPGRYRACSRDALLALLAGDALTRMGAVPGDEDRLDRFREARGLHRAAELEAWLAARGLDRDRLEAVLAQAAAADRLAPLLRAEIDEVMLSLMLLEADHPDRRERAVLAAEGAEHLARAGAAPPSPAFLIGWYCRRTGRPLPESPATLARELGFSDTSALHVALATAHRAEDDHGG